MPAYTLAQAIEATGRSRSALIRAIRSGKLSASRDASGAYLVDASELVRVYPGGSPAGVANGEERPPIWRLGSPPNRPGARYYTTRWRICAAASTSRPSSSARRCSRSGC
jgi:hypothetical protein